MDKQHAQQQWQQAVIAYAKAINHYVAQGRTHPQEGSGYQAPGVKCFCAVPRAISRDR